MYMMISLFDVNTQVQVQGSVQINAVERVAVVLHLKE